MNINGMEWKKVNIAPVYKIDNRQFINNCQPVLLFPICAKVLEKIILKYLFKYIVIFTHRLLSIMYVSKAFDGNKYFH